MDVDIAKIEIYMQIGYKDKNWYAECKKVFLEIFGPEKLILVCQLFAATSINTSLKSNITLFRRALYEIENGLPVGNYLPNIKNQLTLIREGKPLSGRKINAFARAMAGDLDAVVVDVWLLRAFGLDRKYIRHTGHHAGRARSGGPTDKQFSLIEDWCRNYGREKLIFPCEVSSMIWAGCRIHTNGDRQTHYKDSIRQSFTNLFNCI